MGKITAKQKIVMLTFGYLLLMGQILNSNLVLLNYIQQRRLHGMRHVNNRIFTAKFGIKKKIRGCLKNLTRSGIWFKTVFLAGKLTDEGWRENFRMCKNTFDLICEELRPVLTSKHNSLNVFWRRKEMVSVEKKVAIGLYYLASCCEYRIVANQFGVHQRTVCKVVHQFVRAVIKILMPKYISFPNEVSAMENANLFEHKSKIPNIIGAIDGTHIPILPPSDGYRDFVNRKGWPSFILQAIVGPKYEFLDISVKQPGRSHDMAALMASSIYKNIQTVMPQGGVNVNGRELPYVIVGDPAYPLLPWLLKGFTGGHLTAVEDSFNVYMNSARVAVEIAFGRLKARWRRTLKRIDSHYSFSPYIIAACCTLHNIVQRYNEHFLARWLKSVEEAELILQQPDQPQNIFADDYAGYDIRIFLSQYLANNYPLRTSNYYGLRE